MSSRGDNQAINVVRTGAAFLVVVSHVRNLFFVDYADVRHSPLAAAFYAVTSLGHAAVIVFFVLSGYWVGGAVLRHVGEQRFSWREYALLRLTRLWLVLLPALALTWVVDRAGVALFASAPIYHGDARYHGIVPQHLVDRHLGIGPALGNAGFLQSLRVPTFGTNGPLWSLAYEFWFYVWFPLLLLAVLRRRRMLQAAYVVLFALSVWLVGTTVLAYFPLWLLGTAVAWRGAGVAVWLRRQHPAVRGSLVTAFAAGTLLTMVAVRAAHAPERYGAPAIGLATAALLALLARDLAPRRRAPALTLRGCSSYAHVSYSLYAIHLPLVAFLAAVLARTSRWQFTVVHGAAAVGALALVMLAAWIFGSWTERRTSAVRAFLRSLWQTEAPAPQTLSR